ncbi:acyl-CoA dehydrogenase family protein [Synechococcus elongatus]|uniref:Acyl-CoA dehydrogenase family protein n=1 Tax=Synechococcus elongatus PCC 11801 TaxID=2219813 RepID=A0AAN1QNG7_SYNEL|nr:acyl-CoA dehydrogenase family protein [Synechococcus elongatus]AZB72631.1 acyl-CoA dehydrogenase [Synechococcus elongatus PCC 11801]
MPTTTLLNEIQALSAADPEHRSQSLDILQLIAQAGWLGLGVDRQQGGNGGSILDAVEAIAAVSEVCLTSGFAFWCQRTFIQYLTASENDWLKSEVLPIVLRAEKAGATGMSNAMKHLSGLEPLRLNAERQTGGIQLQGSLPWASNLVPKQFFVAVATETRDGEVLIVAIPSHALGVERSPDFDLLGMVAASTGALNFDQVWLPDRWIIAEAGRAFLPKVRPSFLLFQCGLPLGTIRAALKAIAPTLSGPSAVLKSRYSQVQIQLEGLTADLHALAQLSEFSLPQLRQLFELRIALTRLATEVTWLELEARGGKGYHAGSTAKRLREVAFLPVLTPSLVQLERELQRTAAEAVA